jgi:hypothetical protein
MCWPQSSVLFGSLTGYREVIAVNSVKCCEHLAFTAFKSEAVFTWHAWWLRWRQCSNLIRRQHMRMRIWRSVSRRVVTDFTKVTFIRNLGNPATQNNLSQYPNPHLIVTSVSAENVLFISAKDRIWYQQNVNSQTRYQSCKQDQRKDGDIFRKMTREEWMKQIRCNF